MKQHFYKIFASKLYKINWLNRMGKNGYHLTAINGYKYTFEHFPEKKYYYSLEHLEYSPESTSAQKYYAEYKEKGIEPIIVSGNWVYFVSVDQPIETNPRVYKSNAKVYLWRSIYLYFFSIWAAIVCGYQFFAADYLERIGHASDGFMDKLEMGSSGTAFDSVLNILEKPINFIIDWINEFYLIWIAERYGANDAYVVLAMLLPVLLLLLVLASCSFNEFISYRRIAKKSNRLQELK